MFFFISSLQPLFLSSKRNPINYNPSPLQVIPYTHHTITLKL